MTTRPEEAVALFKQGFNCSQSVLATYGEQFGLKRQISLSLACGFGMGMGMGETCGAVTGAFMVIGLKHCASNPQDRQVRQEVYELIREFAKRFTARNHSIVCRDLLGCDPSTPEGSKIAIEKGLFKTICPKMVQDAAEILEEMLAKSHL
jgi:C_GCAxxG_C_C family probable redox protein